MYACVLPHCACCCCARQVKTGGFKFEATLAAYPTQTTGERLVLPASVLETLERQGALDPTKPLAFELTALDAATGQAVEITHAGVLEFTAEEGTVRIYKQKLLQFPWTHRGVPCGLRPPLSP